MYSPFISSNRVTVQYNIAQVQTEAFATGQTSQSCFQNQVTINFSSQAFAKTFQVHTNQNLRSYMNKRVNISFVLRARWSLTRSRAEPTSPTVRQFLRRPINIKTFGQRFGLGQNLTAKPESSFR